MVHFFGFLKLLFFCFVVATCISDIVHKVEAIHDLC